MIDYATLVIEEFKILQESCKQSCLEGNTNYLQAACRILARFESFARILNSTCKDFEFNLQVSCKIRNSSIFFLTGSLAKPGG